MNEPRPGTFKLLAALAIAIFAGATGLSRMRSSERETESARQELCGLRAREARLLGSYSYRDRLHGIVRIPIGRAMELLAKEYADADLRYDTSDRPALPPLSTSMEQAPGGGSVGAK